MLLLNLLWKSFSNYNRRLRIIQHVMLTPAPYSCFIWKYPAEEDRSEKTDRAGEREARWHVGFFFGFLCFQVKPCEALTEMWHISAMSKKQQAQHSLICQVRQCFGSVGGLVRLGVLVFLCTCDLKWMCIMHRHPVFVCLSLSALCTFLSVQLVIQASIERNFFFHFTVFKICHAFLKQGKWTERETESCRKSRVGFYHIWQEMLCIGTGECYNHHVNKEDFC